MMIGDRIINDFGDDFGDEEHNGPLAEKAFLREGQQTLTKI